MKKLLVLSFILALVSCKSNEEKALDAIAENLKKSLYDYESYEPISTDIQYLFKNQYGDTVMFDHVIMYVLLQRELDTNTKKENDAMERALIWSDSETAYGSTKFAGYRDEVLSIREKYNIVAKTFLRNIEEAQERKKSGELNYSNYGYLVTHKFRCKNKQGGYEMPTMIYFMDKEFNIMRKLGFMTYEQYKEIIDIMLKEK